MNLFGSILPLVIVLALLAGVLWWLRWASRAHAGRASGRLIRVVETVDLGAGRCLHLVELGGRGLLLASTSQRCELISELETLPIEKPLEDVSWIEVLRARLKRT